MPTLDGPLLRVAAFVSAPSVAPGRPPARIRRGSPAPIARVTILATANRRGLY
jgi:hypothetical protein